MFRLITSRSKGGDFFCVLSSSCRDKDWQCGARTLPWMECPAVHEAKFLGASHYRRRLAYTRFVSFGASTLVNHVLMQVVKRIDGNYQSGDYFSLP